MGRAALSRFFDRRDDIEDRSFAFDHFLGDEQVLARAGLIRSVALGLPTAIGDLGKESLYAWTTTVFMVASVISSMMVRMCHQYLELVTFLTSFVPS